MGNGRWGSAAIEGVRTQDETAVVGLGIQAGVAEHAGRARVVASGH